MAEYAVPYLQAWHNISISMIFLCFNPLLVPINILDTTKTCFTCLSGTCCNCTLPDKDAVINTAMLF